MTSWKSVVNVFIGEGSDFLCQMSRRGQVHEHRRQKEKNILQSYFNTILVILWAWGGGWKYKKDCEVVANFCCVLHKNAHSYGKLSRLPDWSCLLPLPEILITSRITSLKDCTLALPFHLHHRLSCWPINMAMKNRTEGHSCVFTPHTMFRLEQDKASWRLLWNRGRQGEWRCYEGGNRETRELMKGGRDGGRKRKRSVHESRH